MIVIKPILTAIVSIFVALTLLLLIQDTSCFITRTTTTTTATLNGNNKVLVPALVSSSSRRDTHIKFRGRRKTHLFLSDIPQKSDEKQQQKKKDVLDNDKYVEEISPLQTLQQSITFPKAPEDMFTLIGDLLSLSVYGFFDHFISQDVANYMIKSSNTPNKMATLQQQVTGGIAGSSSTTFAGDSIPVWVDSTNEYVTNQLMTMSVSDTILVQYSPILQYTGMAVTLLVSSWLLAGYIHSAFDYKNTIHCKTEHAVIIAGRTWLTSTAILYALLYFINTNHHLYVGDIAYLFDSLTIVTMWRFLACYIFGTGEE